ncbi:MAG: Ldh family oxidoreductase [Candidatus Bathyarchaeia archaeon]
MVTFKAEELRSLTRAVFEAAGASRDEAGKVAELLVRSNLAGHDSHGVIRIPWYVTLIKEGKLKPGAKVEVIRETSSTALVDGNWGFGQVVAWRSMEIAVEKARISGVGTVGVYNCNHVGRLVDYTAFAASQDMVGIMMCNDGAIVAPFGGIDRLFNPGPISVAFPAGSQPPILLDISTAVAAEGKIRVKARRGEKIPFGWIIDKEGRPTDNPADLYAGGAILPLGGDVGYKGFGLGLFVDIMSGALTGSGCASSPEYKGGNGVFMMAVNIANFTSVKDYKRRVDELILRVKASRKAPGVKEILLPGEPELREEQRRLREGIYIEEETWKEIASTAKGLGLDLPLSATRDD